MAMSIMVEAAAGVVGGVDTHRDEHVAVVVDTTGRVRGTEAFPNDRRGHRALHRWMQAHGELVRVGVEGTGSSPMPGWRWLRFLVRIGGAVGCGASQIRLMLRLLLEQRSLRILLRPRNVLMVALKRSER